MEQSGTAAFTPGPWAIAGHQYTPALIQAGAGLNIAKMGGDSLDGDARLIAAAPTVIAEARELCLQLESTDQSWRAARLRAAISAALGQEVTA
jgi:hypothetical protein